MPIDTGGVLVAKSFSCCVVDLPDDLPEKHRVFAEFVEPQRDVIVHQVNRKIRRLLLAVNSVFGRQSSMPAIPLLSRRRSSFIHHARIA